ncbi:MAG TPA: CsbD family protein [Xanthomonadaceae bacterium]|nr:CsbD family protein [Xanthomonadaceae bacterium]
MNKDQVKGRMKTAKGKVKEAAGAMTGNRKLADKGKAEQAAGKIQRGYGDIKEDIKDLTK